MSFQGHMLKSIGNAVCETARSPRPYIDSSHWNASTRRAPAAPGKRSERAAHRGVTWMFVAFASAELDLTAADVAALLEGADSERAAVIRRLFVTGVRTQGSSVSSSPQNRSR